MARFTSLEFMEALGLGYFDYNGAKILLRLLNKKGIAKEVGKISPKGGRGRHMVVYEIPEEITISVKPPDTIPSHPPKKKKKKEEEVQATHEEAAEELVPHVVEQTPVVVEETVPTSKSENDYEWDEGWDEE